MSRFYPDRDVNFQLDKILNEGIEFDDNIRGGFFEFETDGSEQELQHNLGYIPIGFLVLYADDEVNIWAGATSWTVENLYLESSAANVTVRLFVM